MTDAVIVENSSLKFSEVIMASACRNGSVYKATPTSEGAVKEMQRVRYSRIRGTRVQKSSVNLIVGTLGKLSILYTWYGTARKLTRPPTTNAKYDCLDNADSVRVNDERRLYATRYFQIHILFSLCRVLGLNKIGLGSTPGCVKKYLISLHVIQ